MSKGHLHEFAIGTACASFHAVKKRSVDTQVAAGSLTASKLLVMTLACGCGSGANVSATSDASDRDANTADTDTVNSGDAQDAGGVPVCGGQGCGGQGCGPGSVCVTSPGAMFPTCAPVPTLCAGHVTCDCLGSALCPQGLGFSCYDQRSDTLDCISGVACTRTTCSPAAPGPVSCGVATCPTGSVCMTIFSGTPADANTPPDQHCSKIPAACANNPSCDCLSPVLCLGDNSGYSCAVEDSSVKRLLLLTKRH
jgi:hypothetical protein